MFIPLKGRKETDEASPGGGFEEQTEFEARIWLFLAAQPHLMLLKPPHFKCSSAFPPRILFNQRQSFSPPSPWAAFQPPFLGFVDVRGQSPIFLLFFQGVLSSSGGAEGHEHAPNKSCYFHLKTTSVLGNLLSKNDFCMISVLMGGWAIYKTSQRWNISCSNSSLGGLGDFPAGICGN